MEKCAAHEGSATKMQVICYNFSVSFEAFLVIASRPMLLPPSFLQNAFALRASGAAFFH
jgi:hypothetical protein